MEETALRKRPRTRSPRALVVDDEPAICEFLESTLKELGFDVICAHDVHTALRISRDRDLFDVAFVDLALPDRSGLELIAELNRSQPDLPVVMATTWSAMASADRDRGSQNRLILGKPYDQKAVADVIQRLNL